jgi:hypothetical protein
MAFDSNPDQLTNVGGTLYFRADDGANGFELWRSDQTPERAASNPLELVNVGGKLFFAADTENPMAPGLDASDPAEFTSFDARLFFRADDGTHGAEVGSSGPKGREASRTSTPLRAPPSRRRASSAPRPRAAGRHRALRSQ